MPGCEDSAWEVARGLLPLWNYNYLSCPSNSSTSTHMHAGTHTHIDSCEVSGNVIVCLNLLLIYRHTAASAILLCVGVPILVPTKAVLWVTKKRIICCAMCECVLIFVFLFVFVHLSAWFLGLGGILTCLWGSVVSADSFVRFFWVTRGHLLRCAFCMWTRRLRKPTDIRKVLS